VQRTTRGLLVWRKADGAIAFTNGSRTWVAGADGVQQRRNDERFPWEAPAVNAAVAPALYTGVTTTSSSQPALNDMAGQFFKALNADRQANGFAPLVLNSELSSYAQTRAQGLLAAGGALTHYDASGQLVLREIMDNNHIPYATAGENLAENNYNPAQTVDIANTALMNSATHRANILGPTYQQVGIGLTGPSPARRPVLLRAAVPAASYAVVSSGKLVAATRPPASRV